MLPLAALLAVSANTKASVDLLAAAEPFAKNWQRCVGSGHMLLGTRADWQSQLALAVNELGFGAIRGHGLLDDDMGVLPAKGRLEFYNVDQARTRTHHAHTHAHTHTRTHAYAPETRVHCGFRLPGGRGSLPTLEPNPGEIAISGVSR